MSAPTRPMLRYHGGKWRIAPWIISHFPPHRIYVEPFGGGASVLLRKPRSYAEIYNDLDGEIVNLFRVARDAGAALLGAVRDTPFARAEFDLSYQPAADPIEQARRTLVRCGMGFGSSAMNTVNKTGFRGSATRSGTTPATDWANTPDNLCKVIKRLRGVTIECRPAIEVMAYHDGPDTLHYLDPPYVHETRQWHGGKESYRHEMTTQDHEQLRKTVGAMRGFVIISGYDCDLYRSLYRGWTMLQTRALADKAAKRIECLWLSPNIPTDFATVGCMS